MFFPLSHFFLSRSLLILTSLFFASGVECSASCDTPTHTQIEITKTNYPSLPAAAVERSGTVGGISGNALIELGGVDVQGQPVLEAIVLPLNPLNSNHEVTAAATSWLSIPFPEARAWAASAQHGDAVILAGGLLNGAPTEKVSEIVWKDGKLSSRDLPPLPKPVLGAGGALVGSKFYVVGGTPTLGAHEASRDVLMLDLENPDHGWKPLDPLPGLGKVLPMVTGQYELLEVFGGRTPDGKGGFAASRDVLIYRAKPAEGSKTTGWSQGADLPIALAGGAAVPSGQAHTVVFGADSTPSVTDSLALNEGTESPTLLFHEVTDAWIQSGATIVPRLPLTALDAGGGLILFGGKGLHEPMHISTPRTARSLALIDYAMIALYFIFIAFIGYHFRNQSSTEEFALGNRQTPWWAAGISMFATAASAISFMAVPALAFATNLVWCFPLIVLLPVYFFQSRITFPILRRLEITSTFEYLERRFNVSIRLIASFIQIFYQTFGRASIVLVLPSIAINATTGLDVRWSVIIMGILTTIYTGMGGFEGVTWTLVFQGVLKTLAPIAIICFCIAGLPGGIGEFFHTNLVHHKFDYAIWGWDLGFPLVWIMLINIFLQNTIFQAGDQTIIQRVFASKDNEIRKVTAMNFSCGAFIGVLVTVMGLAIFAYFHAHPEKFDAASTIDQIVPLFVTQAMPHGVVGIVIAAIFASAMATVAGSMNSVATIFTVDFYERWFPQSDDKKSLRMMRISSYVVGVLATLIALWLTTLNLKSIMVTWNILSSLLGGGVVGIFSLGMFSTRANSGGAVCGAILSILIGLYVKFFTGIHWSFLLPILIFSAMIVGYICSFFFKDEEKELTGLTIFHLK